MNCFLQSRVLIARQTLLMYTRSKAKNVAQKYEIKHEESLRKFYMTVNNSDTAEIEYTKENNVLDLTESYVPENLRGKGLGRILAEGTFNYIEEHNLKAKITCTFIQKFYDENRDKYKHLVVK